MGIEGSVRSVSMSVSLELARHARSILSRDKTTGTLFLSSRAVQYKTVQCSFGCFCSWGARSTLT